MIIAEKLMKASGKEISYTHIKNGGSKVCFMLSGAGYTYDRPLLYYSTMLMIEKNIDVIQIHYSYTAEELSQPLDKVSAMINKDVDPIVHERTNAYESRIFLGKSVGTIPILHKYKDEPKTKSILLTPLLKYEQFATLLERNKNGVLVFTGTEDHHYIHQRIKPLRDRTHVTLVEIPNADHSLDHSPVNTLRSIESTKQVCTAIREFI